MINDKSVEQANEEMKNQQEPENEEMVVIERNQSFRNLDQISYEFQYGLSDCDQEPYANNVFGTKDKQWRGMKKNNITKLEDYSERKSAQISEFNYATIPSELQKKH